MLKDFFKGPSKEEKRAMKAEIPRMLAAMRQMNEQMVRRQKERDCRQAETRDIIARIKARPPIAINLPLRTYSRETEEYQRRIRELEAENRRLRRLPFVNRAKKD